MQNETAALECLNCWYINDFEAENCTQCGAILQFKSRPEPHRDRLAANAAADPPKNDQTLKIVICALIVIGALGIIGYEISRPKEPVKVIRPQQYNIVSDDQSAMSEKAAVKRSTAEEIGTKPLDSEKEKEAVAKEYRDNGGDEGCSTQITINQYGQRVPMPPDPDKPPTIHGIMVGVYYEKIENYALAEAKFDIDRTCGENSRGTFTVQRQYIWKSLGSGFFHWEYQPNGFDQRITALVRKQRGGAGASNQEVNEKSRQPER